MPRTPLLVPASSAPPRFRIRPIPAFAGAVIGGLLAIVGSGVVSIGVAFLVLPASALTPEALQDPAFMERVMSNYPIVASSVVATGFFLVVVPMLTAKLSKVSIKEALGFRGAPPLTFVLAPIGILALGPTSDRLVMWMQEYFPNWTMNALGSIEAFVTAHPAWMLWPIIALAPGISEEVFFRGLVQRAAGFGRFAIILSAVSFSCFHMDPHHVAGVLPLGFYLAWLGARTGTTLVPIVAHVANNSTALLASKLAGPEANITAAEHLPLWSLPVGWLIAGGCVYGIWRVTKDRKRWLGPAAEEVTPPLTVSPDWRIVRSVGAVESVLGYIRQAHLRPPGVGVGIFQAGPALDELLPSLPPRVAHSHALLEGFELEDLRDGQRYDFKFHLDFETGQAVFELPGLELGDDGTPGPDPSEAASDSTETPEAPGASEGAGASDDGQPAEPSA